MAHSKSSFIKYSAPTAFVGPAIIERINPIVGIFGPSKLLARETLRYAAASIEEIMVEIDTEHQRRGTTRPTWKKYQRAEAGNVLVFETFKPKRDGRNVRDIPIKFYAQLIQDMKDAIDGLISDTRIPDSRAAFLVRAFANNVGVPRRAFNSNNKLQDGVTTLKATLNPLTLAQAGEWPFASGYLVDPGVWKGIGADGTRRVQLSPGGIETTDSDYPLPEWGGTVGNAAGLDAPFDSTNRPVFSRKNDTNTSAGVGAGQVDLDQGYGHFGHLYHTLQMVRWQPPLVEWFPDNHPPRDYTPNLFSNLTPNLNWVLAQPRETTILGNWGFWIIQGFVGVQNNQALIRVYNNPRAVTGSQGNCPFSVFFPPPQVTCSCGWAESAYFIWWSNTSGFAWNNLQLFQIGGDRAKPKPFGPNTKFKIKFTGTSSGGDNVTKARFLVGVRTARISNVNLQPFHFIITRNLSFTGTLEVNLQQRLNELLGAQYPIGGVDQIDALILLVEGSAGASWECDTEYNQSGGFIPRSCLTQVTCSVPTVQVLVDYIHLDEEGLSGRDAVTSYPN